MNKKTESYLRKVIEDIVIPRYPEINGYNLGMSNGFLTISYNTTRQLFGNERSKIYTDTKTMVRMVGIVDKFEPIILFKYMNKPYA